MTNKTDEFVLMTVGQLANELNNDPTVSEREAAIFLKLVQAIDEIEELTRKLHGNDTRIESQEGR